MATSTIASLKSAKPAQVTVTFNNKKLTFTGANTGELVSTIELSSSFTRPVLMALIKIQKVALEKLNLENITTEFEKSTVVITVTQKGSDYSFTRRFMIDKVVDPTVSGSQSKDYILQCYDVYGYSLSSSLYQYKDNVYNDSPLNNVINYLNDVFKGVKEKYEDDAVTPLTHEVSYEYKYDDLPKEYQTNDVKDNLQITNNAPIVSLREYCNKYNIRVYQDYKGFHVIQNPVLSKFPKFGYYLSDKCSSDNPYYICDYKLNSNNKEGNVLKELKRVTVTDGKNCTIKQVDPNVLLECVMLNDNIEGCKGYLPKEPREGQGNTNVTTCGLTCDELYKALACKTLAVYLPGEIKSLYPGVQVTLNMLYNTEDQTKQSQGDNTLSKNWLITGSTYKIILGPEGTCYCRLVLNRFDDPKDITSKEDISVYEIAKNKYLSDVNLSGIIDDIKGALRDTLNKFRNTFDSLKNSIYGVKNLLTQWKDGLIGDTLKSLKDLKTALKSFKEILKTAKEEAKRTKMIYNSSKDASLGFDLINEINDEFEGIDLNNLFDDFYESLEKMEIDEKTKNEFKFEIEDARRDLNKFKSDVKDLFKDYYNNNNRNINNKILNNKTINGVVSTANKTKEELNALREKKLREIREKQGI